MQPKLVAIGMLAATFLLPSVSFAQDVPSRPDAGSADGVTAGGTTGPASVVVDSCGHPVVPGQPAAGALLAGGTTANTRPQTDVKDETSQPPTVSAVEGTLVHAEGDLLLVQVPQLPAMGTDRPQGATPISGLAVIRLPQDCATPPLVDGSRVSAVGTPSTNGILEAETFQLQ
jgi:hypothetical protein